jgi:ketosteroid isomerase-like protein
MAEHPSVQLYHQLLNAFMARDAQATKDLLAEDVRWHEAGSDDVIEGRDALMARFTAIDQLADNSIDVHDVVANDEHVVAMVSVSLTKQDGTSVAYRAVEVAHVDDGRLRERWAFMDAVPDDVQSFFADIG